MRMEDIDHGIEPAFGDLGVVIQQVEEPTSDMRDCAIAGAQKTEVGLVFNITQPADCREHANLRVTGRIFNHDHLIGASRWMAGDRYQTGECVSEHAVGRNHDRHQRIVPYRKPQRLKRQSLRRLIENERCA